MKKWTIIIGIVFLVVTLQLSLLYKGFKENEVAQAEQAVGIARSHINFASIESVEYYPGDQGYHVIIGKNSQDKKMITWVQGNTVWEQPLSEGVSQKHIVSQLPDAEIKRIIPGMMTTDEGEKQPIWDVYYVTDKGDPLYEYFDFLTGESIAKIAL